MTRLLYCITYVVVVICFLTTFSIPGVASESEDAPPTTYYNYYTKSDKKSKSQKKEKSQKKSKEIKGCKSEKEEKSWKVTSKSIKSGKSWKSVELGYGVQAYECDKQMNQLASEDRVTKIVGTVILICFVPNQEAKNDGIGLKEITNFKWETTTRDGDALRHDAITNGKDDGYLTVVTCLNSNKPQDQLELEGKGICIMESMLYSKFYVDTASVMGSGEAIFQTKDRVDGTVPVDVDIFQGGDKLPMKTKPTNDSFKKGKSKSTKSSSNKEKKESKSKSTKSKST